MNCKNKELKIQKTKKNNPKFNIKMKFKNLIKK